MVLNVTRQEALDLVLELIQTLQSRNSIELEKRMKEIDASDEYLRVSISRLQDTEGGE